APSEPFVLWNLAASELACDYAYRALHTAERLRSEAPGLALPYEVLGEVHLKLHNDETAERNCRAALAIDAESYSGLNNLGVALRRQGRKTEAIDCFHRAAKLDPNQRVARSNLKRSVERFLRPGGVALLLLWLLLRGMTAATLTATESAVAAAVMGGSLVGY